MNRIKKQTNKRTNKTKTKKKRKNKTVMSKVGQITTCYLRILVNSAIYSKTAIFLTNFINEAQVTVYDFS